MNFLHTTLNLDSPKVMGILNVTPDSFSDGGRFSTVSNAINHAEEMITSGADFIDVGGESTRPGADDVTEQEELDRVVPVIEALHARFDTVISIDTSKPAVMKAAVDAGAGLINDVRALQEPGALEVAAHAQVAVCLMHMRGQPRSMQDAPHYDNVQTDVHDFLHARAQACIEAGIHKDQILIDPGFGFGKSLAHNYQLLAQLEALHLLGYPLLVGMSRKSMIGQLLNRTTDERLAGSVALATIAALKGAQIIRVHDVKETVDAVKIVSMLQKENNNE
ncbi:dihydropteroate synthase [Paraglaciecola chathamensis]|uniref:dihydropteroate synthase n=1 Tax=Paraglaciecola chathamensis TaxID=368405 RepID=UPI00270049C0|nr:dihydropteroate synthase [Paraglaciecola chathamensis]MDO6560007.1 dihydropteroate synthase [Paraglaciecola chathamensis]